MNDAFPPDAAPAPRAAAQPRLAIQAPRRRGTPLGWLLGLVTLALLPALGVAGLAAWQADQAERALAQARLDEGAQTLAMAVERDLAGVVAALTGFAGSPGFGARGGDRPDLEALRAEAARLAPRIGAGIFVVGRDGSRLLGTVQPVPISFEPREIAETVFVTGQPVVGNPAAGPVPVVVAVPVPGLDQPADHEGWLMAGATLDPARLRAVLAAQRLPEGTFAAIVDARGRLVARSDALHEAMLGRSIPLGHAARIVAGERGTHRGTSMDGVERIFAFHAVPSAPGWRVSVAQPAAAAEASGGVAGLVAAGIGAALLLGAGGALVVARRLAGPAGAAPGAAGERPAGEAEQLRRSLAAAEGALRAREAELAVLLATTGEAVFVLDRDWLVTQVSGPGAALAEHGGEGPGGLAGRSFWHAFPSTVGGPLWDACRRSMGERVPARAEAFAATRDRRLEAACHPRPDGGLLVVLRDVTQQRTAALRLAESEARFRGLADALPILAFECDRTGANTWASASWADYTGLPAAGLGQGGWLAAMHPDDVPGISAAWGAAVRAEVPYVRHKRIRRADGAWRWHLVRALPIRGAGGAVERWLGAAAEVHELVEAEARIAESEARLRALIELSPQVVWTADAEGRMTYASTTWWVTTGQDEGATLGSHAWLQAVHPADAGGVFRRWQAAQAEAAGGGAGVYECEFRLRSVAEGGWRWFLTRGRPERSGAGRVVRWVGVSFDVHDRKAAEARLADSEARLRVALEAGKVGTFAWDMATGLLEWDDRIRALWALAPETPVSVEAFYAGVHPEDVAQVDADVAAALDPAGPGIFESEFRVIGATDGIERHIAGHGRVVFADGKPVRMVGVNHDVTPMRRAAQVLAREAAQLEELAERRARALAESEARLAEAARMEALGRLAGGIAHDFNNVLQAVQGGLRLAERRLEEDPAAVRRYLGMASDAAARGASVTGRLLSFARRGALRAEPVPAGLLLEELAEMLRAALGPAIRVAVEAPEGLPPLWGDRGQLDSVLVNLANNARDAMRGEGEIRLLAAAVSAPAPGAPPGLAPGGYVRLSVADAGEGMSPEVLARVTEPFFTTKPRGQGTGLGLAMARGFAEQSGGALAIESEPGRGTTVSLWLPRAPAEAGARRAAEAGSAPGPRAAAGLALLLAEDEPEVREILATELGERGFAVSAACDAAGALALLDRGFRPDAVVTDLAMPGGMDGLGLVEEVRRRLPRLPAVLVTGHAGEASSEQLQAVERGGPFALVRKPAAANVLVERLDRVLGERRAMGVE